MACCDHSELYVSRIWHGFFGREAWNGLKFHSLSDLRTLAYILDVFA